MSYCLTELETAVYSRLSGDTTLTGLLVTHPEGSSAGVGIYNTRAPATDAAGSVLPCVVYAVSAIANDDTLRTRIRLCTVEISVYVGRSFTSAVTRGTSIIERIEGDWQAQTAGTAPTYGLDRFKPTLTGTWTADIFEFQDMLTAHDESDFHWVYRLNIRLSQAGA